MEAQPELRGVIGACLTPFDADGRVDEAALVAEIEYLVADVDAIAVAAVEAAEYQVLDDRGRQDLIRATVDLVDHRVPVIAGASAPSVGGVRDRIDQAAVAGADLAQVLIPNSPWGGKSSHDQLVSFFTEIAADSALPLVAYHNPATGTDLDIATYVALSRIDRIVCFKESSRDITKISRLIHLLEGHAAYFTTMQPMLITLLLGGAGATMPPPGTRIAARIRDAVAAGNLDTAVAWQQIFAFFPATWGRYGLTPVMKAAMRHAGVDIGVPLSPFSEITAEVDASLGRFITECGLLQGSPATTDRLRELVGA